MPEHDAAKGGPMRVLKLEVAWTWSMRAWASWTSRRAIWRPSRTRSPT